MAHFDDDANFYPTIPAAENFNIYPHFYPMPDVGAEIIQPLDNFENSWNVTDQCGFLSDPLTVGPVPNSYDSEAPEILYPTQSEDYTQPMYPGQHIPEVQPQPQFSRSQFSSLSGWDGCLATGVASEPPAVVPTPSNGPLGCLGENPSGYPLNTFPENVYIPYQPNTGPARTMVCQRRRFQPYGAYPTHSAEYANAEAGPSTLAPPLITGSGGLPATQPSGGIPETQADADKNPINTEEDKVPKPKPAKAPHAKGKPRKDRKRIQAEIPTLRKWAQRRKFLQDPPTINVALAIAVEAISETREMVNQEPCLKLFGTKCDSRTVSGRTGKERERRAIGRRLYQELSKYYSRGSGPWTIQSLLCKVTEDLETHTELKILSEQDPEARIPTMPVWIPRRIPGIKFFDATTGF